MLLYIIIKLLYVSPPPPPRLPILYSSFILCIPTNKYHVKDHLKSNS